MEQHASLDEDESNILKSVYLKRKAFYMGQRQNIISSTDTLTVGQLREHFISNFPDRSFADGTDSLTLRQKLVKHMEAYREKKNKNSF